MSAPDHRPYLAEGDLRTPEDVAAWLEEETRIGGSLRLSGAWHVRSELARRLARERRQACRRGALACWRAYAAMVRDYDASPADRFALGRSRLLHAAESVRCDALAFRAAARQP